MVFPEDVGGWLSESEGQRLADLARGKRVLEIGSYMGRSTICMAQTAKSVTCIDPFDGRGTPEKVNTKPRFDTNLERYGITNVTAHVGTTAEVAPQLSGQFDLVFIDGAHDYRSVNKDIYWAGKLLAPGGLLAFHDYRRPIDPEVTAAVDDYISHGATLLDLTDTVATVRPGQAEIRKVDENKPLVFLALPSYAGKCSIGAAENFFLTPTRGKVNVVRGRANSSFLTKTFNDLWCSALNARKFGVTHFAMIHDDITPEHHWLDILMDELVRLDADVVGAVSPIKTSAGWTSIAMSQSDADPWFRRRLTMHEVYRLPETFDAADVKEHLGFDGQLLMNTGLWVGRLDRPWCEQVCFDVYNRIVKRDGEWHAEAISEDWLFGSWLNRLGAKVYVTRKATLMHDGTATYTTDHAWGEQQTDEVYETIARRKKDAESQVHPELSGEGCGVSEQEERAVCPAGA